LLSIVVNSLVRSMGSGHLPDAEALGGKLSYGSAPAIAAVVDDAEVRYPALLGSPGAQRLRNESLERGAARRHWRRGHFFCRKPLPCMGVPVPPSLASPKGFLPGIARANGL
jgi:hypothetical protein